MSSNVRFAVRALLRSPGFTFLAIVVLLAARRAARINPIEALRTE